jgi:hypothetical protein
MFVLKRVLAVYLLLIALVTGINWIATPLYHDGTANYWIWETLNWFMAVAVIIVLVVNAIRKHCFSRGEEGDKAATRDYLEINLAFAASIVLTLWYFWNWFASLNPGSEPDVVGLIHLEWWAFINPIGVLVYAYTGAHLWRSAAGGRG